MEDPGLWKKVRLQVTRTNLSVLPALLGTGRLRDVCRITVEEAAVTEELLKAEVKHQGLHEMICSSSDKYYLDPCLLAGLVSGLEELLKTDTRLSRKEIENIFEGVAGETEHKGLRIWNVVYNMESWRRNWPGRQQRAD